MSEGSTAQGYRVSKILRQTGNALLRHKSSRRQQSSCHTHSWCATHWYSCHDM